MLEGSRTGLDVGLSPHQATECVLEVAAPEQEGRFVLGITLVQEHVAWFDDVSQGNGCCQTVRVSSATPLDLLIEEIRWMGECERRLCEQQHPAAAPAGTPFLDATAIRETVPVGLSTTRREAAAARVAAELEPTLTKEREYRQLIGDLREIVHSVAPAGSTVLVVNRGDARLLDFDNRDGWHFPQDPSGTYAGFYPADSMAAITHLESLRKRGAEFLVFPHTSCWWLDHYEGLRDYLDEHYQRAWSDRRCVIYDLKGPADRVATLRSAGEQANGRSHVAALPSSEPTAPTILSDWEHARRHYRGPGDEPSRAESA